MHTLEEIYQQLLATQQKVADSQSKLQQMEQHLQSAGLVGVVAGMVPVPAGSFLMGATTNAGHESISGAEPQHPVTNAAAILVDRFEVTKAQWDAVQIWATNHGYAFENAGLGKATNHPVHSVNWYDCVKWCNARSEMDGFVPCYTVSGSVYRAGAQEPVCDWGASGYRLPTEAEWERAARGGASGFRFPWSDAQSIQHTRANYYSTDTDGYDTSSTRNLHPAYSGGGEPNTSPAGAFAPNGYGIHDMAGNVWEWCWDWFSLSYYSGSPGLDPTGPAGPASVRVIRGGAYNVTAQYARCAYRNANTPGSADQSVGFRCVRRP